MRCLAIGLAVVAMLACSAASAQQAALPKPVEDALAGYAATCSENGGKPQPPQQLRKAAQSADFDGDGKPDYFIYSGAIVCMGAGGLFSGSGGGDTDLYLSSHGYRPDPKASIFGYEPIIETSVRPARLLVPTKSGVTTTYAWDGRTMTLQRGSAATAPAQRPARVEPWQVGQMPDGAVYANSPEVGPVKSVMTLCLGRGYRAALWIPGYPGGRPIAVDFVGRSVTLSYRMQDQTQQLWAVELRDPALLALLTSDESTIALRVDGRDMGSMPLMGADRAIRTALAKCPRMLPPPTPQPVPVALPPAPLPPAEVQYPGMAPGHVAGYPPPVVKYIDELRVSCTQAGGRMRMDKGSVLLGDVDGDARIDHVVNESAFRCEGAVINPYCGTEGCGVTPFLTSRGDRPEQGFIAQSAEIDNRTRPARLVMSGRNGEWVRVWNGRSFASPGKR